VVTNTYAVRAAKPKLVGQFEFVEWTPDNHLRHSRFVALWEDQNPREVVREEKGRGAPAAASCSGENCSRQTPLHHIQYLIQDTEVTDHMCEG
jgi:hypothetical protein